MDYGPWGHKGDTTEATASDSMIINIVVNNDV